MDAIDCRRTRSTSPPGHPRRAPRLRDGRARGRRRGRDRRRHRARCARCSARRSTPERRASARAAPTTIASIDGERDPGRRGDGARARGHRRARSRASATACSRPSPTSTWRRRRERFDAEFDVLERMAEAADGHPISISLMQRDLDADAVEVDPRARREGQRDGHPDPPPGRRARHRRAARLRGDVPSVHRLPQLQGHRARSRSTSACAACAIPSFKQRILAEKTEQGRRRRQRRSRPWPTASSRTSSMISMRMFRLGENPNYEPPREDSLFAEAHEAGKTPLEVIYDALLENDGKRAALLPGLQLHGVRPRRRARRCSSHPLALPGLSDGGAHVGTVCDASFPTFMLTHWARDRKRGRFSLERVVKMMTARHAPLHRPHRSRHDRASAQRADLNVIDLATLRARIARASSPTSPRAASACSSDADGYRATIVARQAHRARRRAHRRAARPRRAHLLIIVFAIHTMAFKSY